MNAKLIPGVIAAAAVVLCAVCWWTLPALQPAQAAVDAEAAVHLERARRLLHRYNHGVTYKSSALDRLAYQDVDVAVEDKDALLDSAGEAFQTGFEQRWEAFPPYDFDVAEPDLPPRPARVPTGGLSRQIREGLAARDRILDQNADLLKEALAAVDEALRVTSGDASSQLHPEANRLKGVILLHQGTAKRLEADVLRHQAEPLRIQLGTLGAECRIMAGESPAAATAAGTDEPLGASPPPAAGAAPPLRLEDNVAEAVEQLKADRAVLADVEQSMADLQAQIDAAQSHADEARAAIDRLTRAGIDLAAEGTEQAAERFEAELLEHSRRFREADREVRALTFGTYPTAKLGVPGDYLEGRYIEAGSGAEPTSAPGLAHFAAQRDVVAERIAMREKAIDEMRTDIERLKARDEVGRTESARREARLTTARERAAALYDELNMLDAEASAAEEAALAQFDKAARAFQLAAQGVRQWMDEGRDIADTLSPTAQERSAAATRSQSRWMEGAVAAEEADARLAKAWVYYRQFVLDKRNEQLLASEAGPLGLKEADSAAEGFKAAAAHDAAVSEVEQAMRRLYDDHRDVDRHWTVVAQAATADDLLGLLGHPKYAKDAEEAYAKAVSNREDDPAAQPFVRRQQELEQR